MTDVQDCAPVKVTSVHDAPELFESQRWRRYMAAAIFVPSEETARPTQRPNGPESLVHEAPESVERHKLSPDVPS